VKQLQGKIINIIAIIIIIPRLRFKVSRAAAAAAANFLFLIVMRFPSFHRKQQCVSK
jgi:hypothetical protein